MDLSRGWAWVRGELFQGLRRLFTPQRGLPTAVTCQGMTLGGRKFLTYTKEVGPSQVQPVIGEVAWVEMP